MSRPDVDVVSQNAASQECFFAMNVASHWTVRNTAAKYSQGRHQLSFDAAKPQLGVSYECAGTQHSGAVRIALPGGQLQKESIHECYVRVNDLVATYEQVDSRTVKPQIYWRVLEAAEDFVLQTLLSMETSLLESEPATLVSSNLESGELLMRADDAWAATNGEGRATGYLHRSASTSGLSFFQLVHPTDLVYSSSAADHSQAAFHLFDQSLEKGVIRRARIIAGWTNRSADEETAERYYQQLLAEAPPLTT